MLKILATVGLTVLLAGCSVSFGSSRNYSVPQRPYVIHQNYYPVQQMMRCGVVPVQTYYGVVFRRVCA